MRAIFIDRDGVINRSLVLGGKPFAPSLLSDFEFLPGVKDALALTKQAGFMNIVVTNQPDLGTGKIDHAEFNLIQERCLSELEIDEIKICPHIEADQCNCRKPLPGMILDAAREFDIVLAQSYMIGDRWRDIECGQAAGCRTNFFIDYGYNEKRPDPPYVIIRSLGEAVQIILEETQLLKLRNKV